MFTERQNVFGISMDRTEGAQILSLSSFKRHTILLKGDKIRTRITNLIDFIDSATEPFATEM